MRHATESIFSPFPFHIQSRTSDNIFGKDRSGFKYPTKVQYKQGAELIVISATVAIRNHYLCSMFQIAVWLVFFLLTFPPRNSNTNNPYHVVTAWTTRTIPTLQTPIARSGSSITYCQRKLLSSKLSPPWVPLSATAGNGDNNEEKDDQSEEYDDLQGYEKTFSIDENEEDSDPKLGIDIGSMLDPLLDER